MYCAFWLMDCGLMVVVVLGGRTLYVS